LKKEELDEIISTIEADYMKTFQSFYGPKQFEKPISQNEINKIQN